MIRLRSGDLGETWEFFGEFPRFDDQSGWLRTLSDQLRDEIENAANEFTEHANARKFRDLPEKSYEGRGIYSYSASNGFGIALLTDDIVSLWQSTYRYTGGVHGNSGMDGANYWKIDGRPVRFTLHEIFRPDSNAVQKLATYCFESLRRQGAQFIVAPPRPEFRVSSINGRDLSGSFLINHGGLIFHFDHNSVGPYADGPYTVYVPWSEVQDQLRPDTPVAKLVGLK
jgi:hypothetical protein